MKKIYLLSMTLLLSLPLYSQDSLSVFGSRIKYSRPDSTQWNIVQNGIDKQSGNYILLFKHKAKKDTLEKKVEPVLTLLCEQVADSMDIMKYSMWKRKQVRFKINSIIGADTKDLGCPNSIGYEGEYVIDVSHRILVGHFRRNLIGVQVICDAAEGDYAEVESDMRLFLKSVILEDK